MKRLNALDWIAVLLVILGGLNWGLIGVLNFDLVSTIFGAMTLTTKIIYALVGLASIYTIYLSTILRKKVKNQ